MNLLQWIRSLFGPKPPPPPRPEDPLRATVREAVHAARGMAQQAESQAFIQGRREHRIAELAKETIRKIEHAREGLRQCDD